MYSNLQFVCQYIWPIRLSEPKSKVLSFFFSIKFKNKEIVNTVLYHILYLIIVLIYIQCSIKTLYGHFSVHRRLWSLV